MAADQRLIGFVERALERGIARADIERALLAAGWRRDDVREALAAFSDSDLALPVPTPRPYLSAKEAFLYLVLFTCLYLCAWNLGSLLFELIESAFPDSSNPSWREGDPDTIRWAVAWLVVAFPLFLGLSRHLELGLRKDPTKRGSRVRKWLTYLTLYVAATVIVGDLATLVFNLLGGELTTRFLLKAATVAAIAGAIFGYYLTELRAEERGGGATSGERRRGVWAGAAGLVVLAAVIAGVVHLGSPADSRRRRLDAERVSDLRSLSHQIEEHLRRTGALPEAIGAVASQAWSDEIGRDPETGVPYEYLPLEGRRYRLCASFALPSPEPRRPTEPDFWRHPAGPHCYDIEITEESP